MLDLVEEHLNQMPLAVYVEIILPEFLPVRSRRYYRDASASFDPIHKFIAVVSLVSKHILSPYVTTVDKLRSCSDIRNVVSRQQETERTAQSIYNGVDFCGESTPIPTKRLLFQPPLAPAAC